MATPDVTLTHLNRADGSATYTHNGFSLIGAVNGPIEVQRRDEIPDEATLEVNVRPAVGVGSPRERHLERLVDSTLRSVILTRLIPRTLVQITLQVRTLPDEDSSSGVNTSLTLLPHLLHTAYLALLSASIPLATTLTSVLIAFPAAASHAPLLAPTANELLRARPIRSAHVFAFAGDRRLLLNESDGTLTHAEWTDACEAAEDVCCAEDADDGGVPLDGMDVDGQAQQGLNLDRWLRDVATRKVAHEQRWKAGA